MGSDAVAGGEEVGTAGLVVVAGRVPRSVRLLFSLADAPPPLPLFLHNSYSTLTTLTKSTTRIQFFTPSRERLRAAHRESPPPHTSLLRPFSRARDLSLIRGP